MKGILLPAAALVALLAGPIEAQPVLTRPLTAEEVECNREQLFGLAQLFDTRTPRPFTLFFSYRSGEVITPLLVSNQWPTFREREPPPSERGPEYHLAATLIFNERLPVLNPERPLIDQLSLLRDNASSTLTSFLVVSLEMRQFFGDTLFVVNNARGPSGRIGGIRPSRALREVEATGVCHEAFTAEDLRVFTILRRILRFRYQSPFPYDVHGGESVAAVYRMPEPDVYGIDVYTYDVGVLFPGALTLRVVLARDEAHGQLRSARIEIPPVGESVEVFVIPPHDPSQVIWSEADPRVHRAELPAFGEGATLEVDLLDLLGGTTWNPPRF